MVCVSRGGDPYICLWTLGPFLVAEDDRCVPGGYCPFMLSGWLADPTGGPSPKEGSTIEQNLPRLPVSFGT